MEQKVISTKRQRNILIIVIILLLAGIGYGVNRISSLKTQLTVSEQNNRALADTVRVSENKIGDLEYSKSILISEKRELKNLNVDLAEELKKEKGKVRELTKIVSEIKSDTVYITNTLITYPDGSYGLDWIHDKIFDDENERHIAGVSKFDLDSNGVITPLETIITRDDIKFNLITGLRETKDGNVEIFVRSDYPNFVPSSIDGAIIDPKKHPVMKKFTKKKRFGIGPYVGLGLGVNMTPNANIGLGFNVGIGVHYSILRF